MSAAVGMSQEYCKGLSGSLFSLLCFVYFTAHICKNITKMSVIPRVGRLRFQYEFGTSSVGVQYEFGMSSVQVRYKFSTSSVQVQYMSSDHSEPRNLKTQMCFG